MAPRKQADDDFDENPGEGSFVAGYERTIPAAASAPRRVERPAAAPAASGADGGVPLDTPAARRREQLRQARAAREAAAGTSSDSWASAAFASATSAMGRQTSEPDPPADPGRPPAATAAVATAESVEDLMALPVKEIKARIKACGCTIPSMAMEKAELVAMLQIFSKAASRDAPAKQEDSAAAKQEDSARAAPAKVEETPPTTARTRARSRGAFSAAASRAEASQPTKSPDAKASEASRPSGLSRGAEQASAPSTFESRPREEAKPAREEVKPAREEVKPSTEEPASAAAPGRARRGFAQWRGGAPGGAGPDTEAASAPAASAASNARPDVNEEELAALPLKELKRQLRELNVEIPPSVCEKSEIVALLARSLRRSGGARQAAAEPPPAESFAPSARRPEPSTSGQDDEEAARRSAAEQERKAQRAEAQRRAAEEEQQRMEERRREQQKRVDSRRRRLQEAEADEDVAPPPPPPPPPEDLSKLSMRELKERLKEAGVPIPPSIIEKQDLVNILKKVLQRKAATEASQKQAAEDQKKKQRDKDKDLVPCRNRCGFAVTWHPTHCCNMCPNHGPKCNKKPMPADWDPYESGGPQYCPRAGAGSSGPLPQTAGKADKLDDLLRLSVKELKKKCGAAGVTVPRNSEREDLAELLQDAQRRRRSLRSPGEFEAAEAEKAGDEGEQEDDEPEEDYSKLTMRELRTKITQYGGKVPSSVKEKSELITLCRNAKRRAPKCNSKCKHIGANGSFDRRRSDDSKPWLPRDKSGPQKSREQVPPAGPPDEEDRDGLWQTFGYIAGTEEGSPYARFDIREDVCVRFGGFKHGALIKDRQKGELAIVVGVKRCQGRPMLWIHSKKNKKPSSFFYTGCTAKQMRQLWEQVGEEELLEVHPMEQEIVEDSDEELHRICARCRLPVGDLAYVNEENGQMLAQHADCITKGMIESTMEQDQERVLQDWTRTWTNRKEFDIGWVPSRMIPINERIAHRLGGNASGPMVSLLMEGEPPTLSLTQSVEPTTSVNLNYLITALKVRIYDGREPVFSLDPCPPFDDMRNGFQKKRFEPEWMNGSPAGEVLFQADYHLKELSMGEYDQAINGMKNAMDHSEDTNYWDWRAREWFIVKTAEVWRSQDGVIMPNLVMGVEAREQVVSDKGTLEDAPMTNPDHPLVIFGDSFTHNFDLIAERLSVIYHLRELTKAQIIARFIMDSGVKLDESWLNVLGKDALTELRIPQHRREIGRLQLRVYNGEYYQEPGQELGLNIWGVYGGVDLNLDNFDLSEAQQSDKSVLPGDPIDLESLSEDELRQMIIDHGGTVPPGITEKPDLIDIMMHIMESFSDFWGSISGSGPSPYSREDQALLRKIFNPHLSDRRLDRDRFIPPTRDQEYIDKLRKLVDEEWFISEERRNIFMSPDFTPGQHSPPFPYTWRSKYGVAIDQHEVRAIGELAKGRPLKKVANSKASLDKLSQMKLIFDGLTEDGTRYRIYTSGKMEVRTIQEHDQAEAIAAVFMVERPQPVTSDGALSGKESVIQVTLCTGVGGEGPLSSLEMGDQEDTEAMPHYRFFVLAETKGSRGNHRIITEMLSDGTVTWEEDPPDLEHRRSRAGVINSLCCKNTSVQKLREYRKEHVGKHSPFASASACKHYAQGAFQRAGGVVES